MSSSRLKNDSIKDEQNDSEIDQTTQGELKSIEFENIKSFRSQNIAPHRAKSEDLIKAQSGVNDDDGSLEVIFRDPSNESVGGPNLPVGKHYSLDGNIKESLEIKSVDSKSKRSSQIELNHPSLDLKTINANAPESLQNSFQQETIRSGMTVPSLRSNMTAASHRSNMTGTSLHQSLTATSLKQLPITSEGHQIALLTVSEHRQSAEAAAREAPVILGLLGFDPNSSKSAEEQWNDAHREGKRPQLCVALPLTQSSLNNHSIRQEPSIRSSMSTQNTRASESGQINSSIQSSEIDSDFDSELYFPICSNSERAKPSRSIEILYTNGGSHSSRSSKSTNSTITNRRRSRSRSASTTSSYSSESRKHKRRRSKKRKQKRRKSRSTSSDSSKSHSRRPKKRPNKKKKTSNKSPSRKAKSPRKKKRRH